MNFTKMQGAGNDFIVVEAGNESRDWARIAIAACDRHFGIGGDGLLLVLPSDIADVRMRLFNADGSEAEMCGNGIRCLVRYIADRGVVPRGELSVETLAGIRRVKLITVNGGIRFQVGMGQPRLAAAEIPVKVTGKNRLDITLDYPVRVDGEQVPLSFVSMGNPHAVLFWQRPVSDFPLSQLGPQVERHRIFPNRTNFEVARVVNREQIEARVWERGVGETLACGTGACAIAVAARLHGYTGDRVDIKLPGGILNVEWDGRGEVFLSGPAEVVYTGEWRSEVPAK